MRPRQFVGGGADARVLQWRDQLREPAARQSHVGIGEHENFEIGRQRFYCAAQVENLLAAILGRAGDHDVDGLRACGFHALDDFQRRVETCGQREVNFVVGVLKTGERREVIFEPALISFAGADQRRCRSVKAGVGREAAPHHAEPLESIPERIDTKCDLHHDQNVEEGGHSARIARIRRVAATFAD
jgi:hypothetical protein